MSIIKEIICPSCKEKFLPKSPKNIYCSRRCFKKAYYHKKKKEERLNKEKFPIFKCPSCESRIELDFDPVVDHLKWAHFKCPNCGTLMICVFEDIVTNDVPIEE